MAFLAWNHAVEPSSTPMTAPSTMLLMDEIAAFAKLVTSEIRLSRSTLSHPTRVHSFDDRGLAARTAVVARTMPNDSVLESQNRRIVFNVNEGGQILREPRSSRFYPRGVLAGAHSDQVGNCPPDGTATCYQYFDTSGMPRVNKSEKEKWHRSQPHAADDLSHQSIRVIGEHPCHSVMNSNTRLLQPTKNTRASAE